jgi:hypothetical protein
VAWIVLPRHGEELKRDRLGTESEPRSLRIEPKGTEWGLRPLTIEQTTEDVTAIHRLAASRHRGRRLLATGRGLGTRAKIRGKAGATVRDASRTSDQDGPEPGHLTTEARSEDTEAGGALGRRANGTGAPARDCGSPRTELESGSRRRAWPTAEDAVRAVRKEVSTGTN